MIRDVLEDSRFRRFMHYAYFPMVFLISLIICFWIFRIELDDDLEDSEQIQVIIVKDTSKESTNPLSELRLRFQLTQCQQENKKAEEEFLRLDTVQAWKDWSVTDKKCRELQEQLSKFGE